MNTETLSETHRSRHAILLVTLELVEVTTVETRLRRFLDSRGGGINEWDQCFLDFLARHRGQRFLSGAAGDGFEIVFCPRASSGYWLFESRAGSSGKGFLASRDAERLHELARQKGLVAG